jgi:PAS domain S-box-containing protein
MNKTNPNFKLYPLRIVLIYFIIGALWILFSDQIVFISHNSPAMKAFLSFIKGMVYVIITSILLYLLISKATHSLKKINDELELKAEEAEHSRMKLGNLFLQSPIGIFYALPEGKFTQVNPAFAKMLGYASPEEVMLSVNNISTEIFANESTIDRVLAALPEKGRWTDIEGPYRHKNGSIMMASMTLRKIFDPESGSEQIEGFVVDVTERRQIQKELLEQKSFFEQMFLQSITSTEILDKDGWVLRINSKLSELFAVLPENIENHKYNIFQDGEIQKKGIDKILRAVFENKVSATWEVLFDVENASKSQGIKLEKIRKSWFSVKAYPILNEQGELANVIVQHEDVTDRKTAEDALVASKEKAEEMNRLKSSFLANMSHELRTPMIGILGFSEILAGSAQDANARELAEIIFNSGRRLMETLNLILDLSRIEAGKLNLNYSAFDLSEEIKDICTWLNPAARKKGLTINFNPAHDTHFINLDRKLCHEIISNLVNNAVKFTKSGGVTIDTLEEQDSIVIRICDTGIGIAQEDFGLIFEEFRQISEGLNRSFEGAGLGLSLTKKFVEKLNGTIYVESTVGKGTTFTVTFPKLEITTWDTIQQPVEKSGGTISRRISGTGENLPSALYVEDDTVSFEIITHMLKGICSLEQAKNSEEALKKAVAKKYDLIFMDINLGSGLDGAQTAALMRKIDSYKNTPIAAVTAFAMVGDREEFLASGCSHYISKPFGKKEICDFVAGILKELEQTQG